MAVSRAGDLLGGSAVVTATTLVSGPPQRCVEFGFKQFLYEAANASANLASQGIEPIIAEKMVDFGGFGGSLRANPRDGVIFVGALTPILVCFHKLEITTHSNFNHS